MSQAESNDFIQSSESIHSWCEQWMTAWDRRLYNRENSGINQDQEVLEHGVSVDMKTMKCDQENNSHNVFGI